MNHLEFSKTLFNQMILKEPFYQSKSLEKQNIFGSYLAEEPLKSKHLTGAIYFSPIQ